MLANPDKFIKDAARHFGTSASYLYQIKNSDAFRIYWQSVSGEVTDNVQKNVQDNAGALTEKAASVSTQALDALAEKLDLQASTMPVDTLIDISNLGLKALGYSAKGKAQPNVTVNLNAVDPTALARAREKMQKQFGINSEEPKQLEAQPIDVVAEKIE